MRVEQLEDDADDSWMFTAPGRLRLHHLLEVVCEGIEGGGQTLGEVLETRGNLCRGLTFIWPMTMLFFCKAVLSLLGLIVEAMHFGACLPTCKFGPCNDCCCLPKYTRQACSQVWGATGNPRAEGCDFAFLSLGQDGCGSRLFPHLCFSAMGGGGGVACRSRCRGDSFWLNRDRQLPLQGLLGFCLLSFSRFFWRSWWSSLLDSERTR